MKKKFYTSLVPILLLGLLFSSCQKEEHELIDETPNETITANSVLAEMLVSASQNNGYVDDIIDGSSCSSVELPVTVFANSQELTISTLADLQNIHAIFDEYPGDIDTLEIVFPIVVISEDYSETEIANQTELDAFTADCFNFIGDTYVCVEFEYPISCFIYNTSNEQLGDITIDTDHDWFEYLNYITDDIIIAIDYGMTVIVNNEPYLINNNQELTNAFAQADCEVVVTTVDPDVEILRDILKNGAWHISEYLDDGEDETQEYQGYNYNFLDSITVYATNGVDYVYGTWVVTVVNGGLNLDFDMDSPLNGTDDHDYKVFQYNENTVTFVTFDSDNVIEDTLTFQKN
ncbi:hypothetical protein [Ulvibacter litoralis]|uniref:Uncharacterized protein n=1 Tax=Ulvibacter litoralis TaxID=227084 RepID=A0A1G7BUV0_9FLAO|nr:hypothetical protein [Ulvibacter litoralis]SDE30849.1 hypothetical protein SAMN05421855_10130 [Ulvibacter litoralis]